MKDTSKRLIFLDNLRSFALLLGLVFHAAIVYAESIGYALKSSERSSVLDDFCFFVHSFRMPLFFFLSGFFSEMVWARKGLGEYWRSRRDRLILPFFIGIALLAPIQYFIMELDKRDSIQLAEFYWEYWTGMEYGLSHLWFLQHLILYCILLVIIPGKNTFFRFPNSKNSVFLLFFFSITLGLTLISHSFFPKGWRLLKIDVYLFLYYFTFFFAGIIAYRNRAIFHETEIGRRYKVILFLFAIILLAFFEYYEMNDPLWMGYFWGGGLKRILHISISAVTAWAFIYFFIELFKRFFYEENSFSIYLRDSSLPIYLIHHPISLVTGYILLDSNLSLYPKFILHLGIVLIVSFGIYDSLIRVSPLWRKLMGMKQD